MLGLDLKKGTFLFWFGVFVGLLGSCLLVFVRYQYFTTAHSEWLMEENVLRFINSISINATVIHKYDIKLYWLTLPDETFSAQTSIASAKFLVLRQSLNLSQQFPFNFCSFPAGQGKPLPLGEPSLVGTQLCPFWLLLGIKGLCGQWEGQKPR